MKGYRIENLDRTTLKHKHNPEKEKRRNNFCLISVGHSPCIYFHLAVSVREGYCAHQVSLSYSEGLQSEEGEVFRFLSASDEMNAGSLRFDDGGWVESIQVVWETSLNRPVSSWNHKKCERSECWWSEQQRRKRRGEHWAVLFVSVEQQLSSLSRRSIRNGADSDASRREEKNSARRLLKLKQNSNTKTSHTPYESIADECAVPAWLQLTVNITCCTRCVVQSAANFFRLKKHLIEGS